MQPAKPIKGFVTARAQSVQDQLAGKSPGADNSEQGFGGGHNHLFGPGVFLARNLMETFDTNKDGKLTHDEFTAGFAKWFQDWNTDKSGLLTEEQLRTGINQDLSPFHGGPPPGGPGFGPPGDEPNR
jgi:hypothetical protein